jgi:alkaline phosphatase
MAKKLAAVFLCMQFILAVSLAWSEPKNVILLIGDGMGFEQVKAAGMYEYGSGGTMLFETFPHKGQVTTYSADSSITDSAAAATAIATGTKVNNGVISVALPGGGESLYTLLEYFRDNGKSTGLVTTTPMTHATPAAFGSHEDSRNNTNEIALDYLQQTRPNVLFGSGDYGMSKSAATSAGYTVVANKKAMQRLNTNAETMVSGQFGVDLFPYEYDGYDGSLPHLSEMTATALDILDNDADGFFLMIEGGHIDWAGHDNNIQRNIFETIEFENAVQTVYDWALGRSDTLILVTADHETGGLTVLQNNGQGNLPTVSWSTTGHTNSNVPVYARGENSYMISGVMDNTEFFSVITSTSLYYCDSDGDNYISSAVSGYCQGTGCEPVGCEADAGNDCDDYAGAINPGAPENCTDGFDNDCDGDTDDNDVDCAGGCQETGSLSIVSGQSVSGSSIDLTSLLMAYNATNLTFEVREPGEVCPAQTDESVITTFDTWKYNDDNYGNIGATWGNAEYDDSSWNTGSGAFGHSSQATFINTPIGAPGTPPDYSDAQMSMYFRNTFTICDPPPAWDAGSIFEDDGQGGLTLLKQGTVSSHAAWSTDPNTPYYIEFNLDSHIDKLVSDTNVIAVGIYNVDNASSDLLFDGELVISHNASSYADILFVGDDAEAQFVRTGSERERCYMPDSTSPGTRYISI